MASYDPAQVRAAQVTPRFSVLARTGVDVATLGTWDADLLHEPRVLVPVDVQAYVVPAAGAEPALALPGPLSPGHGTDAAVVDGPPPFTAGTPRPAGIHLSWAMPDALQRGRLQDPRQGSGGGLGMGALPDRWAVLRVLAAAAPAAGTPPTAIRGWLLDAAAGAARGLATGAGGVPLPQDPARPLTPGELTGTAGGSLTWTGSYDAAYSRFAWHDPLDDLTADPQLGGTLPGGAFGGTATYVVVGWYSTAALDPLDGVRTTDSLAERLAGLGWRLITGGGDEGASREGTLGRLADLDVTVASRLDPAAAVARTASRPAGQPAEPAVPPSRTARARRRPWPRTSRRCRPTRRSARPAWPARRPAGSPAPGRAWRHPRCCTAPCSACRCPGSRSPGTRSRPTCGLTRPRSGSWPATTWTT